MNKKLSLLLISSIISSVVMINGEIAEASIAKQTSDGAIINSYGLGYEQELNHIYESSLPKLEKYYQMTEVCIKYIDFNEAEDYFIDYISELSAAQQNNKAEFYKSFNKMQNLLRETANRFPSNAYPKCFLAKLSHLVGDYDSAFDLIKECIKLDKKNSFYKYELASLYMDTQQYEKAIRILEQLKLQYPREKEFRVALASAYEGLGMYNDAVREYRVAVAFEPEDNDAVAALVSASTYSQFIAKNQPFYDPMTAVAKRPATTATTVSKQDVIAFGTSTAPAFSSSKTYTTSIKDAKGKYVTATKTSNVPKTVSSDSQSHVTLAHSQAQPSQTAQNTGVAEISDRYQNVDRQEASQSVANEPSSQQKSSVYNLTNNKASQQQPMALNQRQPKTPRSASSNKRVMVSYINGRKVVKIVNISQDSDVSQTLSNYSGSLSKQFADMNSNGNASNQDAYSFSSSDNTQTNNSSYTTSKYNYTDDYYSNTSSNNGTTGAGTIPKLKIKNPPANNQTVQKTAEPAVKNEKTKNAAENKKLKIKDTETKKNQNPKSSNASQTGQSENTELYLKANELLAQNQYQQVIDLLGKINPPTLRSLTSIASCYNALGNTDAAIDYYNRADKISPNNSQILFSLAYLYFSKNEVEKAKNYLNQSLQIDPNNANALQLKTFMSQQDSNGDMNKAISYMNSGNYTDSKKILDKLAEKDASNFQVYYYLGHVCYATQKYADAVQDFLKAIKLNSEYALSYYSLGLAYDKLKKFNDSLASYERFVQMSTDDNKYTQYAKTRISTIKAKK